MKVSVKTITLADETAEALAAYADRRGITLKTAVAYAVRSGLLRLDTCRRYALSPKGRRAAQRAKGKR